jgi:hypothetical protein
MRKQEGAWHTSLWASILRLEVPDVNTIQGSAASAILRMHILLAQLESVGFRFWEFCANVVNFDRK